MSALSPIPEKGYKIELKWLMFFRVLFSLVLLGATTVLQLGESATPIGPSLLVLYGFIITIFVISLIYSLLLKRVKNEVSFAFIQIGIGAEWRQDAEIFKFDQTSKLDTAKACNNHCPPHRQQHTRINDDH